MKKSIITLVALFTALLAIMPSTEAATEYPTKPIIMIVPYGAGGSTDLAARAIAATIPKYLGQGVIVDNKPGGSGQIARQYTMQAKPDGYTMHMLAIGSGVMTPALNPSLPIKWENYTYVAITQLNPIILAVNSKSHIKSIHDLAKELKEKPGKLKFSSSGPGSSESAGAHIFFKALGLKPDAAIEIPFDSAAESTGALLGGHVDFHWQTNPTVVPNVQAGKLRALAVSTAKRLDSMKDVPTTAELGFPQLDFLGFRGVIGPPKLPDYVVKKWDEALQKVTKDKSWLEILSKFGDEPTYIGPDKARAFVEKEFKRYRELFTELDILVK